MPPLSLVHVHARDVLCHHRDFYFHSSHFHVEVVESGHFVDGRGQQGSALDVFNQPSLLQLLSHLKRGIYRHDGGFRWIISSVKRFHYLRNHSCSHATSGYLSQLRTEMIQVVLDEKLVFLRAVFVKLRKLPVLFIPGGAVTLWDDKHGRLHAIGTWLSGYFDPRGVIPMDVVQDLKKAIQTGHGSVIFYSHVQVRFVCLLVLPAEDVLLGLLATHLLVTLSVRLLARPAAVHCDPATWAILLAAVNRNSGCTHFAHFAADVVCVGFV